jgi:WD40 repeat protein
MGSAAGRLLVLGTILASGIAPARGQESKILIETADRSPARLYGMTPVSSLSRVEPQVSLRQLSEVTAVVFSPDGSTLVSSGADGVLRSWDVRASFAPRAPADGGVLDLRDACGPLSSLAFTAEGDRLAFGGGEFSPDAPRHDRTVGILSWKSPVGAPMYLPGPPAPVLAVSFRAQGDLLGCGGTDGSIRLCSLSDGKVLRTLEGNHKTITCLAFTPDGLTLYAGAGDGTLRAWDVEKGSLRNTLPGGNRPVSALSVSPDGRLLASAGSDARIRLWETLSGQQIVRFPSHDGWIRALAFSADGDRLVSAGWDRTVRIRHLPTGHEDVFPAPAAVSSVAISPAGDWIAAGRADGVLMLWKPPRADDREPRLAKLQVLWEALAGEDPLPAQAAVWEWSRIVRGPEAGTRAEALKFLKERLAPVDKDAVERLIGQLDDDDADRRQKASRDLEKFGAGAEPVLRHALSATDSVELRTRISEVLKRIASSVIRAPDVLRSVRAIQVVEKAGGDEAVDVLRKIAAGADASRETVEARASLARLQKRTQK